MALCRTFLRLTISNKSHLGLLDLSDAFDCVDREILLARLQRCMGLDGVVLSWLRSFLTDRSQRSVKLWPKLVNFLCSLNCCSMFRRGRPVALYALHGRPV